MKHDQRLCCDQHARIEFQDDDCIGRLPIIVILYLLHARRAVVNLRGLGSHAMRLCLKLQVENPLTRKVTGTVTGSVTGPVIGTGETRGP